MARTLTTSSFYWWEGETDIQTKFKWDWEKLIKKSKQILDEAAYYMCSILLDKIVKLAIQKTDSHERILRESSLTP